MLSCSSLSSLSNGIDAAVGVKVEGCELKAGILASSRRWRNSIKATTSWFLGRVRSLRLTVRSLRLTGKRRWMSSRLVARERATYDDAGSMRGSGGFRMSRMINKWRN